MSVARQRKRDGQQMDRKQVQQKIEQRYAPEYNQRIRRRPFAALEPRQQQDGRSFDTRWGRCLLPATSARPTVRALRRKDDETKRVFVNGSESRYPILTSSLIRGDDAEYALNRAPRCGVRQVALDLGCQFRNNFVTHAPGHGPDLVVPKCVKNAA